MKAENIVITEADYMRLQRLVASSRLFGQRDAKHLDDLAQELERAAIMKAGEVPSDVVTMNSRVRVKDLNSGRVTTYQIVFPGEADIAKNRISVLAPIGTGLLGYSAGMTVEMAGPLRHTTVPHSGSGISTGRSTCSGLDDGNQC
jgi:regulator of nucleoside diphosphate kinase